MCGIFSTMPEVVLLFPQSPKALPMHDLEAIELVAKRLAAIGEPTRIRIIDLLVSGTKSVSEIATLLRIEIVNVSHHLGVMKNSGIVKEKKRGRFVDYSLHPDLFQESKGKTVAELDWCRVTLAK
jgi:ArsR family transcriptional regulator, nickel/cobalt-responsive transcriptional repressor